MQDFNRKNLLFSLCGLNCGLCTMQLGGHCPGCGGGSGNQPCAIAKCSLMHDKVEYCFLCFEYPCKKYEGVEDFDSFMTHQKQLKDNARIQEMGQKAYMEEQTKKVAILQKLLDEYNDGRKKTFYCVAVNLLPLNELENVMKQVHDHSSQGGLTIKEKAEYISNSFQRIAIEQGLVLKLRKKPAQ